MSSFLRRLVYKFIKAPLDYGRPFSKEIFDHEYHLFPFRTQRAHGQQIIPHVHRMEAAVLSNSQEQTWVITILRPALIHP